MNLSVYAIRSLLKRTAKSKHNPNAKYDTELATALEGFFYEELLEGIENRTGYDNFINGRTNFSEHMQHYLAVIKTFVYHNILRNEHFSYSATTRGKEFTTGKIAMINGSIYDIKSDTFEFSYMPFPNTKGTD